jgi:hypothetical protein
MMSGGMALRKVSEEARVWNRRSMDTHSHISVATGPGLTVFTVIPYSWPNSTAQVLEKLSKQAFEAPYAVCIFQPVGIMSAGMII